MTAVATEVELRSVLDGLPPVQHAFGYGSGVMPQPQPKQQHKNDNENNGQEQARRVAGTVVDFVFAVDSPREWHAENMARNPHHYAGHLRVLG
jgi:translocator assembly and maintenance protein 41